MVTEKTSKPAMAAWLKWLIGLGVFCCVLTCGLIALGSFFLKDTLDKTVDPVNIERVADSVADFSKPLPTGFKIDAASEMLNIKTLVISHHPERMTITWTVATVQSSDPMSKGFESGFDAGLKSASTGSFQLVSQGKLPIADQLLEYKIGNQSYKSGRYPVLRGRINGVPEKLISIVAFSDSDKPFNLTLFQKFLDGVQSVSP